MTPRQRLLKRIVKQDRPDGCWLWTGPLSINGYGSIGVAEKTLYVHRLAHELWLGPIPKGRWVLHRCGNRACCNPDHLYTNQGTASLEQRLLRKIVKQANGCWIWRGQSNKHYGQIELSGRVRTVHRVAYELWIEPIPDGLVVLHLCGHQLCCNPAHLVAGTAQECAQYMIECRRNSNKGYTEGTKEACFGTPY
jgi:hypothetical protein